MRSRYILPLLAAVMLFACGSEEDYECSFRVTPYTQYEKGGQEIVNIDVDGYYFYADTVDFFVDSYEMAASGTIAAKDGSGNMPAAGTFFRYNTGELLFDGLDQPAVMIVLFDNVTKIYSWRPFYLERGIPYVINKIRFRTWRAGTTYKESGWTVVVPPAPEEPEEPGEEGEEESGGEEGGESGGGE